MEILLKEYEFIEIILIKSMNIILLTNWILLKDYESLKVNKLKVVVGKEF